MQELISLKTKQEDFEVDYEIVSPLSFKSDIDSIRLEIENDIQNVDQMIEKNNELIDSYNVEIDRLTNHADKYDYIVAVASGVITGAIDVFLVGEFDFASSKSSVDSAVDKFVQKKAQNIKINDKIQSAIQSAQKKGKDLSPQKIKEIKESIKNQPMDKTEAIRYLEKKFSIPSDSVYNQKGSGVTSKSHHLDDLAHHPTIIGLAASILTQFTGNAYFANKSGNNLKIKAQMIKTVKRGKEVVEVQLIGTDLRTKLICGVINWLGHLLSDLAGSSSSAAKGNAGMGLPGPILSTLKELSMLPILKNTTLPQILNDLFTKDNAIFGQFRLDFRSELAIGMELGKQAIPIFINELIVRGFFFIRRFIQEAKNANTIRDINWKAIMPWKNRTITRMLTISLATFEAIDLGDAAIRGAINSCGTVPGFFATFVLRVNFVGIGRFAIACGTDIGMGVKKKSYEDAKQEVITKQLYLQEAKLFLKNASVYVSLAESFSKTKIMINKEEKCWIELKENHNEILNLVNMVYSVNDYYKKIEEENNAILQQINNSIENAEEKNPGLLADLFGR